MPPCSAPRWSVDAGLCRPVPVSRGTYLMLLHTLESTIAACLDYGLADARLLRRLTVAALCRCELHHAAEEVAELEEAAWLQGLVCGFCCGEEGPR